MRVDQINRYAQRDFAFVVVIGQTGPGFIVQCNQSARVADQLLSGRRQHNTSALPMEQLGIEGSFKPLDLHANSRLRQVILLGRLGHRAGIGYGDQRAQGADIEISHTSVSVMGSITNDRCSSVFLSP